MNLTAVDSVDILTVVDNFVDVLLDGDEMVKRPPLAKGGKIPRSTLLAEHGLSLFIKMTAGDKQASLLRMRAIATLGCPTTWISWGWSWTGWRRWS